MRAAWYERVGLPRDVITVGELPIPELEEDEVRVKVHVSCVNPIDTARRGGMLGQMTFPRVVPHNDGAGVVDEVGSQVRNLAPGDRVWVFNAQTNRALGTASEYLVLPQAQVVRLPDNVDFTTGACLGIPGRTAHRCVFSDGPVEGKTVLVAGGAGSVGMYAIALAKWGGATVIATVASDQQQEIANLVGADHVVNYMTDDVAANIEGLTSRRGVDRIVEVAFGSNIALDERVLARDGVIATYSTPEAQPRVSYWSLVFKSATIRFLGPDAPPESQHVAIADLTACAGLGLLSPRVAMRVPLDGIIEAHEAIDRGSSGKVFVDLVAEPALDAKSELAPGQVRSASA